MLKSVLILLSLAVVAYGRPSHRIINGQDATLGDYPWQVSLQQPYGSGYWHFCGGSLISANYIMTAAHCYKSPTEVTVYAGSVNKFADGSRLEISSFLAHSDYNSGEISMDYGIIQLTATVGLTDYINVIAIPTATDSSIEYTGDAITSGWGYNVYYGQNRPNNELPDILQEAVVPVLSDADCTAVWGSFYQSDNMICAGGDNDDGVCMGDSGGPLVQDINGVTTLIGATSWAPSSCSPGYPSGWAKLSTVRSWIASNTDVDN